MFYCETAQPRYRSLPTSRPVRTTEPTEVQEPLTLAEAKHQCGIAEGVEYHDADIRDAIVAARQQVEADSGLTMFTGAFTWKLTGFPSGDVIEFPLSARPVTSITSITYVDSAGATQTWGAANYSLETNGTIPFIRLAYGCFWPVVRGDINGITITYVAGYASVMAIPKRVKDLCKLAITEAWWSREGESVKAAGARQGYERMMSALHRESYP